VVYIGPEGERAAAKHAGRPERNGHGPKTETRGRALLWVDSVGGYLVCLDDHVTLGRSDATTLADIPLLGDVSRRHATISRSGDGYLIQAIQPTFVNGKPIETALLRDGDVIRLGGSVELGFRVPNAASATARLDLLSRHRLPLAVDAVILMAETCILGPGKQSHIPAARFTAPVVIYRQGGSLWCRAQGAFEVDGRPKVSRSELALSSNVMGEDFSFNLEPLPSRSA
jgi:hypothetical protein